MRAAAATKLLVCSLFAGSALIPLPVSAQDGLANSLHNFNNRNRNVGLCTVCHTPHKAQSQALLWNHDLSTNNFTWGDVKTTAGTVYPSFQGDTYTGNTAKCLSCHDGSVAVGDVGWWNGNPDVSIPGLPVIDGNYQVTADAEGSMTGNHPVAMPYPYLQQQNLYNGQRTGDRYKRLEWVPDPQATYGIPLYTDTGAGVVSGPTQGSTGIECGSCHDVHNGPNVKDVFLLYGTVAGADTNYICLKCHIK